MPSMARQRVVSLIAVYTYKRATKLQHPLLALSISVSGSQPCLHSPLDIDECCTYSWTCLSVCIGVNTKYPRIFQRSSVSFDANHTVGNPHDLTRKVILFTPLLIWLTAISHYYILMSFGIFSLSPGWPIKLVLGTESTWYSFNLTVREIPLSYTIAKTLFIIAGASRVQYSKRNCIVSS